jgi:putative peptide zinc metalloprotease protein
MSGMAKIDLKGPGGTPQNQPLPLFREDLKVFQGPSDPDGAPTFALYDPVKASYFRITWREALVLQVLRPGMTMPQLIEAVENNSTLKVKPEDLATFFQEASANGLLAIYRPSEQLSKDAEKLRLKPLKWLIFHYLYVRIPLINPDNFLDSTLKYAKPFFSKTACIIYGLLIFAGLIQLLTRFSEFIHTFPYFFNLEGIFIYSFAIICVKVIHEFSHAYTAKYFGVRVPTMGVALIVFWPVLYTDVTDSWKLAKRSQRLLISAAGIITESTLAGISTLGWALSPPGLWQSTFFVVSSVTWISTLVVNLNPAMRFDGYYIMCDLLGIDNLQTRAFAITRWKLRKWLLGIDIPPPEEVTKRRETVMVVYSLYTWVYRLFLYTAIAIFVYFQFTRLLGAILFFLEIAIFIAWPIGSEIKELHLLRKFIKFNTRAVISTLVFTGFLLWFIIPFPHVNSFPALTDPIDNQTVYVPFDANLEAIYVKKEDLVVPGQPLIKLYSKSLLGEIAKNKVEKAIAQREILIAQESTEDHSFIPGKLAGISAIDAKLSELEQLQKKLIIRSEINGLIYEWDDTLAVNQYLSKNRVVGKIADFSNLKIIAYVPERYVSEVSKGQEVTFQLRGSLEKVKGHINTISPVSSRYLIHPQVASIYHGDVPVTQDQQGKLIFVESYYIVNVTVNKDSIPLGIGEQGTLYVQGPWRSNLVRLFSYIYSIFIRESNV